MCSPQSWRIAVLALAAAVGTCTLPAREAARAQRLGVTYDPFVRNRVRVSVGGGISASSANTYLRLGVGAGYYLADGLELGLDTDFWLLGDPVVWNLTPGLLYVFQTHSVLRPYVGSFYRHAVVFGAEDLDSLGGRAGVYITSGQAYFGAGAVYEHWLGCNGSTFVDCDAIYPELVLAFSF